MIVVPSPAIATSLEELLALYLNPLYDFAFSAETNLPVIAFLISEET